MRELLCLNERPPVEGPPVSLKLSLNEAGSQTSLMRGPTDLNSTRPKVQRILRLSRPWQGQVRRSSSRRLLQSSLMKVASEVAFILEFVDGGSFEAYNLL
jgi:hypothetical protein